MSISKPHMLQLIEQKQKIANKETLKLAPETFFFMLLTVMFFGHEI